MQAMLKSQVCAGKHTNIIELYQFCRHERSNIRSEFCQKHSDGLMLTICFYGTSFHSFAYSLHNKLSALAFAPTFKSVDKNNSKLWFVYGWHNTHTAQTIIQSLSTLLRTPKHLLIYVFKWATNKPIMWQQCSALNHADTGQQLWIMLTSAIKMGKNGDHSDFDCDMFVDARQAGFSMSITADLLGVLHTKVSYVYSELCNVEMTSGRQQFCRQKSLLIREVNG